MAETDETKETPKPAPAPADPAAARRDKMHEILELSDLGKRHGIAVGMAEGFFNTGLGKWMVRGAQLVILALIVVGIPAAIYAALNQGS